MIVLALLAVLILVWSCLRVSGKADEEYIAELDDFNVGYSWRAIGNVRHSVNHTYSLTPQFLIGGISQRK